MEIASRSDVSSKFAAELVYHEREQGEDQETGGYNYGVKEANKNLGSCQANMLMSRKQSWRGIYRRRHQLVPRGFPTLYEPILMLLRKSVWCDPSQGFSDDSDVKGG